MSKEDIFNKLYHLDVTEKVEKKQGLSYLSWAWAWAEIKLQYPAAEYTIEKFGENKKPYLADDDLGYMVFTTVTIEGLTHEMWLPVMNGANKAMKSVPYDYQVIKYTKGKRDGYTSKTVEPATMFDINKAIMRCLVKNLAMHGLGLFLYAGEDLPEAPPVKKVNETQVSAINAVISTIATLINKNEAATRKMALDGANMPDNVEDLDEVQYGEFLHYLKDIKDGLESKKKEAAKKEEKEEKEEVVEQKTILKGNTTEPNEY